MTDGESPKGWTIETLRQHMLSLFEARDIALNRARQDLEAYKAQSNEWRAALADSRSQLMTRDEWLSGHGQLTSKVDSEVRLLQAQLNGDAGVNMRLTRIESRSGYLSITLFISILSALMTLASVIYTIFHLSAPR